MPTTGTFNTGNPRNLLTRTGWAAFAENCDIIRTQENYLSGAEKWTRTWAAQNGYTVLQDDGDSSNVYERQNAMYVRNSAYEVVKPIYAKTRGDKKKWMVGAIVEHKATKQPSLELGYHASFRQNVPSNLRLATAQAEYAVRAVKILKWPYLVNSGGDLNNGVTGASLKPFYNEGYINWHRRLGRLPTFRDGRTIDHILTLDPEKVVDPTGIRTYKGGSDHYALRFNYSLPVRSTGWDKSIWAAVKVGNFDADPQMDVILPTFPNTPDSNEGPETPDPCKEI